VVLLWWKENVLQCATAAVACCSASGGATKQRILVPENQNPGKFRNHQE